MKGDAAELRADLLDRPLTASPEAEDTGAAARIARTAQLADRGEHASAARDAAELIEAGVYDIRLIGYYLFGLFLERGVAYLPVLLERVGGLVTEHLAALGPARRKLQVVNSATTWLFEHVALRLQFHTKQRDATWEAWREGSHAELVEQIAAGCTKLALALESVIDAPLAAAPLGRVRRWANDDLRRALGRREAPAKGAPAAARARGDARSAGAEPAVASPDDAEFADAKPAGVPPDELAEDLPAPDDNLPAGATAGSDEPPEPEPEPEPELESEDEYAPEDAPPPRRTRARGRPAPAGTADEPVVARAPALAVLQAKLRGFEDLIARGELAKAAVVASDVRAILAHFDPIEYFPALFAGYFKVLHQVVDDLAPYFDRTGDPSWDALVSYYRADLRAFLEDE